jgi:hypothetical protein
MRTTLNLIFLTIVFFSCRAGEITPRSASSIAGRWRVTASTGTFYTDGTPTGTQTQDGSASETFHFFPDGTFRLHQGNDTFAINGKWTLNLEGNQLTVETESGETLNWAISQPRVGRMVLLQVQEVPFNGHTQRLEVVTNCVLIEN